MAFQKGFEKPNHTQTPNSFFDESLKQIKSLCELKVVLTVIRKTFGWQKRQERISLSQLEAVTGLTRQGVQKGVKLAIEHGFIERRAVGQGFVYSLVLGNESYPAKLLPSQDCGLELGNESYQQLGNRLDPQKKEKEKKERSAHSRLMAFHDSHLTGGIPDPAAQGKAIQWLLKTFTPEQCEAEYEKLRSEAWRTTPVTWLTVKKHIGADLAREANSNGRSPSGEKILTDYGDWYTVEGADGTPSKRYRTAEAFARETGRPLEEVKARWN
jgi:phage replication O-like protein O